MKSDAKILRLVCIKQIRTEDPFFSLEAQRRSIFRIFSTRKSTRFLLSLNKSFDSSLNGVVLIRAQLIHNAEELFNDTVIALQKKESLIIESLEILESQMKSFENTNDEK